MSSSVVNDVLAAAAARLSSAASSRRPCPPIRDLISPDDARSAYAVQDLLMRERMASGARVIGRKIGLTSIAVQRQLGVDQPDFGVLLDVMRYRSGETLPIDRLLQPRAEAEIAFVLNCDLDGSGLTSLDVRSAVAYAVPALEIVDSRIRNWDITLADTVADNGSSGLFVLGDQQVSLSSFEPAECSMVMRIDGEQVSTGSGGDCLGDPIEALLWLATTALEFGQPLREGEVILSGALGPMRPVVAGSIVEANISRLGSVECQFA